MPKKKTVITKNKSTKKQTKFGVMVVGGQDPDGVNIQGFVSADSTRELISLDDAAQRLGISRQKIIELVSSGILTKHVLEAGQDLDNTYGVVDVQEVEVLYKTFVLPHVLETSG